MNKLKLWWRKKRFSKLLKVTDYQLRMQRIRELLPLFSLEEMRPILRALKNDHSDYRQRAAHIH